MRQEIVGYYSSTFLLYTLPHDSGGVIWFLVGHPCVSPSVLMDGHLCG